jgi:hypothetical protein
MVNSVVIDGGWVETSWLTGVFRGRVTRLVLNSETIGCQGHHLPSAMLATILVLA